MTPTSHAAQAGIDLDKLEALARKADTDMSAIALFTTTFDPAGVLELISLARNAAQAAPAADEKHLPGWERGIATVTMTGHQLRAALDLINPDGDDDEDQRDDDLTFGIVQHKDDNGTVTTGLCCWNDDTDGVLPLDAYPDARAALAQQAASPAPAPAADVMKWQERVQPDFLAYWKRRGYNPAEGAMMEEIADLRAILAASPAPETAQADDELRRAVRQMSMALAAREWAEHVSRDPDAAALETQITELVGWAARRWRRRGDAGAATSAVSAHAQQDAAQAEPVAKVVETDIDVSVIDAVLPIGTKLYIAPSAATGKAAAANAGGQDLTAKLNTGVFWNMVSKAAGEQDQKEHRRRLLQEIVNTIDEANQASATSAADANAGNQSAYQRGYMDGVAKGRRDVLEDATSAADAKDAERIKALEAEIERYKRAGFSMSQTIHNITVGNQAAWIEWQHGDGSEAAMAWIHNGLVGPGLIPDEDEPHSKEAQAYADANSDHRTYDAAIAASQKGGA